MGVSQFNVIEPCVRELRDAVLGYLVLLGSCLLIEAIVACVSLRGNILMTDPRASMQYLLYIRLGKSNILRRHHFSDSLFLVFIVG